MYGLGVGEDIAIDDLVGMDILKIIGGEIRFLSHDENGVAACCRLNEMVFRAFVEFWASEMHG